MTKLAQIGQKSDDVAPKLMLDRGQDYKLIISFIKIFKKSAN